MRSYYTEEQIDVRSLARLLLIPDLVQDGAMNDIIVRLAKDDELSTVAKLRWQWLHENEGTPVTTREEFLRRFVTWARQNAFSHRCMVMVRGDVVLGMAWLAITQRVPSPLTLERASGDVQCVYVVPDERDNGLGGATHRCGP